MILFVHDERLDPRPDDREDVAAERPELREGARVDAVDLRQAASDADEFRDALEMLPRDRTLHRHCFGLATVQGNLPEILRQLRGFRP